jgi:protein required for attachment to host cells
VSPFEILKGFKKHAYLPQASGDQGTRVAKEVLMENSSLEPIWILVAHESGARIFKRTSRLKTLELIEAIDHPVGRLKNSEIYQDRSGSDEEWGPSAQKHGFQKQLQPVEKNALDFAKHLVGIVDHAYSLNRFAGFVIVAGPQMLGLIRSKLTTQLLHCLVGSVNQNLGNIETREVPKHVDSFLADYDRTAGLTPQSA